MAIDRIYMDSCCFIESVKSSLGNAEEGRENDLWHIHQLLLAARNGHVEVITSYLSLAECRHAKTADGQPPTDEVKRLFRSILASGKVVKLAQLTKATAELSRDLHWDHNINLSGADAVHVATSVVTECKEFLTFDYKKKKSPMAFAEEIKKLRVIVREPHNTILLPEKYRQPNFLENEKTN
jgi:predicted nucleic acid-binding protein